ncbi:MAG: hypothetical protein K2Y22_14495 [Candidatus Obscuribacterales bacterium]|nr:hypothetical protein [Candidatus Obscuribacterales bacterium]
MYDPALKLDNLKRQFGKRFVEAALQSRTFVRALYEIRTNGVRIRLVDGPCRAYYDRRTRTICIGRHCPRTYKIISVVHEYVHALVRPTTDPIPGETGRQEFIDRCLDEETEAIATEVQCVKDLLEAGAKLDPKDLEWFKRFQKGGRKAIRRKLETTVTSTTGEDYPTYYGEWYDEIVPKHKRLP